MQILDLTDKLARFPIAYGYQPVRGWAVKHFDTTIGTSFQRTKQNALGEGPWDACERLYADAFPIDPADFVFHPGDENDSPDINFPTDTSHPWTAYISAKCRVGISEDQTEKLFGIYRTLRTGNYNGSGQQLNSIGTIVTPSDPRTEFFFKPNPANVAVDQILRWGLRANNIVNWPAWVNWRDYNDELIPIDDSTYTPRALSLTPTSGGSLSPGTYYVRVSTMKSGDESSASLKTLEIKSNKIVLTSGQTAFQVNWLIKGDEEIPPSNPSGITGYRVYIGTVDGVWLGYFSVGNPASRNFIITTTSGTTGGNPREIATSGLLVNVKRFECGLFFIPPYDLGQALDQICQISCADWQWSGLGTNTYRNDKIRFMSPADRAPVFTLNLAETGMGSLKTYPVDRRNRPNQVVVNFRDQDDEFLGPAQPVILDREQLQTDDGFIKTHTIEGGTMRRNQAQRVASFYARVLCDMDQMATLMGSPKTYFLLPGDVINVTNPMPNWTDQKFIIRKKNEKVETALGDDILSQVYTNGLYSDTEYHPLPLPLPISTVDPFAVPPPVESVDATQGLFRFVSPGVYVPRLHIGVQFAEFNSPQRARVWIKSPHDELTLGSVDTSLDRISLPGHTYQNGEPLAFRNEGGILPSPLSSLSLYFAVNTVLGTSFQVALTPGGDAIDLTSLGSGTNIVGRYSVQSTLLVPDLTTLFAEMEIDAELGEYRVLVNNESILGVANSLENAVGDTVIILPPLPTVGKLFDNVPPKDNIYSLGLTMGVSQGVGNGPWQGVSIFRDRGYGYELVGTFDKQASIGHSTNNGISWLGDGTGYNILWIIKEGGADFTNATITEIDAGKNNYFLGREKLGVQTWTDMGGGLWKGENLVRGLNHTYIFQSTHVAQQDFIQLDEQMLFLPIEFRDISLTENFKFVSFGLSLVDTTALPITIRGDSLRPYPIDSLAITKDASNDFFKRFQGNPRPQEEPETYNDEVWSDVPDSVGATIKRILPITAGGSHAALLRKSWSTFESETPDKSTHVSKNSGSSSTRRIATINAIQKAGSRIDFGMHYSGTNGALSLGSTEQFPCVWLYQGNPEPFWNPLFPRLTGQPLFGVSWRGGTNPGSVKEVFWKGSTQGQSAVVGGDDPVPTIVFERDNVDPGFGNFKIQDTDPADVGYPGPRYSFQISGTEMRIYRNYQAVLSQPPLLIFASPIGGWTFPLYLVAFTADSNIWVRNVTFGASAELATIYSSREQVIDFGSNQNNLHGRIYQVSKYPEIGKGFYVDYNVTIT